MNEFLLALSLSLEDVMGLLWVGVLAGVFAVLAWCADKLQVWAEAISENYVDD